MALVSKGRVRVAIAGSALIIRWRIGWLTRIFFAIVDGRGLNRLRGAWQIAFKPEKAENQLTGGSISNADSTFGVAANRGNLRRSGTSDWRLLARRLPGVNRVGVHRRAAR